VESSAAAESFLKFSLSRDTNNEQCVVFEWQEDEMAMDFNNQSVAESYALREAMKALMRPEHNFINDLYCGAVNLAESRRWIRNSVINIVMATDMSRHFDLLGQFDLQVARNKQLQGLSSAGKWATMTDAQVLLTLQMAMKVPAQSNA
jgi:hypothetical protein